MKNSHLCASLFKIRLLTWGGLGTQHLLPKQASPRKPARCDAHRFSCFVVGQSLPRITCSPHRWSVEKDRLTVDQCSKSAAARHHPQTLRSSCIPTDYALSSPSHTVLGMLRRCLSGVAQRCVGGQLAARWQGCKAPSSVLSPMQLAELAKNTLCTFPLPSSLPSKLLPGCFSGPSVYTSVTKKKHRNNGFQKPKDSPGNIKHHK